LSKVNRQFILGRCRLRLQSNYPEFLEAVSRMLPPTKEENGAVESEVFSHSASEFVIDLDTPITTFDGQELVLPESDPISAVMYVVDQALRTHKGVLWLEASALLNPDGELVLICGASHAGKTTLSLALCLACGWKIVCEDPTIFDAQNNCLIPFARPFSLRSDAPQRIAEVTSVPLNSLFSDTLYFDFKNCSLAFSPAHFAKAILLSSPNCDTAKPFQVEQVSAATLLRRILPLANFVRYPGAIDFFYQALASAECFIIQGGELNDRFEFCRKFSDSDIIRDPAIE